jgi:hypothetical protein
MAEQPLLSHSLPAKLHQVFTSVDFATKMFLKSKFVGLAPNPQPGEPGRCIYLCHPLTVAHGKIRT